MICIVLYKIFFHCLRFTVDVDDVSKEDDDVITAAVAGLRSKVTGARVHVDKVVHMFIFPLILDSKFI